MPWLSSRGAFSAISTIGWGFPGLSWPPGFGHPAGTPVHAVRDFILVMIGGWPWPTFNLADSSLVCGAALLFVTHSFQSGGDGGRDE